MFNDTRCIAHNKDGFRCGKYTKSVTCIFCPKHATEVSRIRPEDMQMLQAILGIIIPESLRNYFTGDLKQDLLMLQHSFPQLPHYVWEALEQQLEGSRSQALGLRFNAYCSQCNINGKACMKMVFPDEFEAFMKKKMRNPEPTFSRKEMLQLFDTLTCKMHRETPSSLKKTWQLIRTEDLSKMVHKIVHLWKNYPSVAFTAALQYMYVLARENYNVTHPPAKRPSDAILHNLRTAQATMQAEAVYGDISMDHLTLT